MSTTSPEAMLVFVGTFAESLHVYRLDRRSGALAPLHTTTGLHRPTFLALHPQLPVLYAVERQAHEGATDLGAVTAFAFDRDGGRLDLLNRQSTHGIGPCYVSVHPSGRYVLVANYGSGSVVVLPVQPDGSLGEATDVVQHTGRGPDPQRQDTPHAHCIAADPSGTCVLACDLGADRVMVYRLNATTGKLLPHDRPYAQGNSGAGPRHLAFHPNGQYVYVINELDSTLTTYAYGAAQGISQVVQTISTLPDEFVGDNSCAQVMVAPGGRFVYGSNRGHDSLAIFASDPVTGRLRLVGHEPSRGQTPRNFNLDPTGTWLLAANQLSNTIVPFRVDQDAGTLTATTPVTEVPAPSCVIFSHG